PHLGRVVITHGKINILTVWRNAHSTAAGDDPLAIRRVTDGADPRTMALQNPEQLSSGNVPYACGLIIAPRDNPSAVRREAHGKYRSLVAVERANQSAGPGIRQPHRAIFTASDNRLAIGSKSRRKYGAVLINNRQL